MIAPMTKAMRIHRHGGPEVLTLEDVEVGDPGPGEARVRHTAIGLNFIDTYHRTGLYPLDRFPSVLGLEAAGVIEAVGDGVEDLEVGQRVAYATGPVGAYAEARVLPARFLVPVPDGVSDEAAAAGLLKGMTVEYLVRRTHAVEPGETVLWHAAAGGVGLIAVQWLKHLGATVIGTASTDAKRELAKDHGCDHVAGYDDFAAKVHDVTGGAKVPVVYDSVGKTTFLASLDCLAPRGLYVGFGNASGKPDPFDMGILARKGSLFLTRPTLFTYTASREDLLASAAALFEVMASGAVRVDVGQRFPLADAAEAHRALEARATVGSTVLLP